MQRLSLPRVASDREPDDPPGNRPHDVDHAERKRAHSAAEVKSKWPTCPYCGAFIPKSRRRATTCRACGETYYVRGTQTLFKTRVLRREQVAFVELVKTISPFGIDARAIAASTAPAMNADELLIVVLEACDRAADQAGKHTAAIFHAIARFLFDAGRDPRRALTLGAAAELKSLREQGAAHVLLLRSPDADHCETCRQADGRRVPVDDAQAAFPIPCPECIGVNTDGTRGWCSCRYVIAPATKRKIPPAEPAPEEQA